MQVGGPYASRDYIGPDRRQGPPASRQAVDVESLLWLAFALVGAGMVLPVVLSAILSRATSTELVIAERGLVTALFLGAGLLRVARWRLTGESLDAFSGTALAVFALTSYPLGSIGVLVYSDESAGVLNPISRIVAVTICVAMLIRAFRSPTVDSRLRPLRMTVNIVVPVWLAYAGLSILAGAVGRLHVDDHAWAFLELLLTLAWGYSAFRAFVIGTQARRPSLMWAGLGLATMAAGELLRAWAFLELSSPAALSSTGFQLVAASVAVANAARDLGEIFSTEGNRFLSVVATLAHTERILATREQRRQEQVHDARSVIAALRAASLTLERYGDKLEPNDRQTLRSGLTRELARLEHLMEPRALEPTRDFVLQDALQPVIVAEREAGLTVQSTLGEVRAHGRPEDLATVVQNLLVNARRHAPGSPVVLRSEKSGSDVRTYVEDRGPGIPSDERDRVFQRGFRGTTTTGEPGSGLGLYVARTLMKEQGGDIDVVDRPGGGARFVLSLPAASEPVAIGEMKQCTAGT